MRIIAARKLAELRATRARIESDQAAYRAGVRWLADVEKVPVSEIAAALGIHFTNVYKLLPPRGRTGRLPKRRPAEPIGNLQQADAQA